MATRLLTPEESVPTSTVDPERITVTDDEIARRAYHLFLAHGSEHGHDVDDWLQAERELKGAALSEAA